MRHGFHLQLTQGSADAYRDLHRPVPDAVLEQLRSAGIHDFTIFVEGDHVFGVFEYDDAELVALHMSRDVAPEWSKAVGRLFRSRAVDPVLGVVAGMPVAFQFGGTGKPAR
jgi:L-rhamnose mutarotase